MKSLFITVRFDRMKNSDIHTLYHQLISSTNYKKTTVPELLNAINRLEQHKPLTKALATKPRKQLHTAEITKLRTTTDKLIAAILLQIKALSYAQFDEDTKALLIVKGPLTKLFKNYNKKMIPEKATNLHTFNSYIKYQRNFSAAFTDLGLMRFLNKLNEADTEIDRLLELQKKAQEQLPAPNTTQHTKEKVIEEIRFYLRTIDMYLLTHPEVDAETLINVTNNFLKSARTQLRNTTTRRLRRKDKENNDENNDENDNNDDYNEMTSDETEMDEN